MALLASETMVLGFVYTLGGGLVTTTNTTNAAMQQGFLRDPDGRLVVKYS